MKYALIAFLLVAGAKSYGQKAKAKKSFANHFKILDSFALLTNTDTIYEIRCAQSVYFMEKNTKIYSSTNGNFYGRLGFTKENLYRWHEWYRRKYGSEK